MKDQKIEVRVTWDRERPVKLLRRGDQVSEIMWRDTRSRQAISNKFLDFVLEKKEDQKKKETQK